MGVDDENLQQVHQTQRSAVGVRRVGELPAAVRQHLGHELQDLYGSFVDGPQPQRLLDLLEQLDTASAALQKVDTEAFRQGLTDALPKLRGFAIGLTANATKADDLVQETLLKAWQHQHRFEPGTNLNAWLITIARNTYYSERRRRRREIEDIDGRAAGQMITLPAQEHGIELQKVWQVMTVLPALQREALMLVGAQGMTYEAAAGLLGCQVGTVKSRVSRARSHLADTLSFDRARA